MRIVLDTSVLVAASRSRQGASFALVSAIPSLAFEICLSVGLYAEWQEVLARPEHLPPGRSPADAARFLQYLASHAHLQEVYFLWRPFLSDPDDDLVLELAFAARCDYIVTQNVGDFRGSEQLNVAVLNPADFIRLIRQRP